MVIKAVIFDFDGMLYLADEKFSSRYSRKFNVPIESMLEFFDNDFKDCTEGKADMKKVLKKYLTKWQWRKSVEELLEYWFKEGKLNRKIINVIEKLKQKGIICILFTNNEKYRMEHIKKRFEINKIFDNIITSYEIGARKPKKKAFNKILEITKLSPEEIVFCDDKEEHVEIAKKLGFVGILYKELKEFLNELEKVGIRADDQ